jgi:endoglycosylceramidase
MLACPRWYRPVAALLLLLAASPAASALDGRRLRVRDGRLTDGRRREITLRGVNTRANGIFDVTFDDGRLPLEDIPIFDAGDAERMQAFGFNLLRLPINWSALEPMPGVYDGSYLDRIAAVVDACGAHGIVVLLDFHQDAFSKEIGQDGAPRWVLDRLLGPGNYPYLGGPLIDLNARRLAPATLDAFRRFFNNEQNIQATFAAAVGAVARRFRRSRDVLGYELMNEPLSVPATNPAQSLLDFHVRVGTAIRRLDRRHLIVFEPDTLRNLTNQAPLPSAPFPLRGGMYAPHIYTGVFDGQTYSGDPALLTPSMEHAAAEAAAWGTPLLVGEYGIDPGNPHANEWITQELDLQDRLRAHSTFWLWEEISSGHWGLFDGESSEPGGERIGRTTALSRVYARAVPGRVLEHVFDAETNTLRLRFGARGRGPLEIFVPERRYPTGFTLSCDGAAVMVPRDAITDTVTFRCGRGRGEHVVEVAPAP